MSKMMLNELILREVSKASPLKNESVFTEAAFFLNPYTLQEQSRDEEAGTVRSHTLGARYSPRERCIRRGREGSGVSNAKAAGPHVLTCPTPHVPLTGGMEPPNTDLIPDSTVPEHMRTELKRGRRPLSPTPTKE